MNKRTAIGWTVIALGVIGLIGAGVTYFKPQNVIAQKVAGNLLSKLDHLGEHIGEDAGSNLGSTVTDWSSEGIDTKSEEGDLALDVQNAKQLLVTSEVGTIHIVGSTGTADGNLHYKKGYQGNDNEGAQALQDIRIDVKRDGDTVRVNVHNSKSGWLNLMHADLDISIPDALAVEVSNKVGAIKTENLQNTVNATSDVGSIHIQGYKGSCEAHSKTGQLEISGGQDIQSIQADTNVGRVRLSLPASASLSVTASTNTGRVTNALTLADAKIEKQRVSGRLGDGKGKVSLRSNVGSIEITQE
ncbi:DUF4097 family beta strand repeat-containing protein [Tumebacillus flagellatus]|uniref:DUF4097 domain-containing protein n=1 Tax=Tumebacillus flagellatus TaxID=1157490 RepID=A0A074LG18_9BACL|nr:DUF4097 family beta strand repeat-containing protein [Tumebacillus flagellatus]KEO81156.1 hypothetical protein EL26_22125 [Tumebacillus flagellatus]